jgi:hypothetical protein
MSLVPTLSKPQPQLAQLEILFAGPLTKDSQVETVNDLILLNSSYNFPHKTVWVKESKTFYYLDNGTGTELINWVKLSSRVVINKYDVLSTYQRGDCIFLNGKIYSALQDVPINKNPSDYEDYWLSISGETETYRFLFQNTSSVLIYTEIRNPKFEVIIGNFVYEVDENGDPTTTIKLNTETGLAELSNKEIVEAYVRQREDLALNNGVPYEISFFEDDNLSEQLSGCINVK